MIKKCSIDGCEKKSIGRGLCSKHYQRFMFHGSTDKPLGSIKYNNYPTLEPTQAAYVAAILDGEGTIIFDRWWRAFLWNTNLEMMQYLSSVLNIPIGNRREDNIYCISMSQHYLIKVLPQLIDYMHDSNKLEKARMALKHFETLTD